MGEFTFISSSCPLLDREHLQLKLFAKLPIFYLPTGDSTKSPEDQEREEREEEEKEEEDDEQ